jgi:GGDEF domain-containing protein
VRNSLQRFNQGALNNPVTGLPEGTLVEEHLNHCIDASQDIGMLLISLENLDSFRESYGFVASDDVLRAVSLMIHNSMAEPKGEDDFLGHLETTRFVLTAAPQELDELQEKIETRLLQSLDYFYPLKDRAAEKLPGKRLNISLGRYILSGDAPVKDLEKLKTLLIHKP